MYAEVIVDIETEALDRPFTYRVPEALLEKCRPGCAVRIPFGREKSEREIEGYVTRLTEKTELNPAKIKEIRAVTAGTETAEGRLVALAAWMSRRYGSTMIRALKTVVPVRKSYGAVTEKTVYLTDAENAEAAAAAYEKKRRTARARVVRALAGGPLDERTLKAEANVPASVLRAMKEEGVIGITVTEIYRKVTAHAEEAAPDTLSEEQERVLNAVRGEWTHGEGRPVLLEGVTGSGKTVVYTELIADALAEGGQAIVLIPEIALTWQTVLRFVRRFGDKVSFLHSRLSGGERYDQMKAARAGDLSVMVGPRSALFTPFPNLKLIVIDEEHEETYRSETMPRYDARETAIERGRLEGARVLFGSATPSIVSAYRAARGIYLGLALKTRFGGSCLPRAGIIDMREELKKGNRSILSDALREKIGERLRKKEQVMLFLNRRGYAGHISCRACGYVIKCPHCDVSLTRHRNGRLVCHYCGYETREVSTCPSCGSKQIGGMTIGTEQVEEIIGRTFPEARVMRMDLDTTRGKEGHSAILAAFSEGKADILVGTQMIVKGHDFPRVTLVGVLMADLSLSEADYRSAERTYQLIAQAAGRAGRGTLPGEAVIQTYQPEHYAVTAAAAQDYEAFYREEIAYRSILQYPPVSSMLAILGASENEAVLAEAMRYLRRYIDRIDPGGALMAIGPAPQTIRKIRDQSREVIYLRHADAEQLIRARALIEEYIALNSGFKDVQIQFDYS